MKVDVSIPKFSFETERKLLGNLVSYRFFLVGSYNKIGNHPLFISDILQKCKIQVDENGTKAAAATAILARNQTAVIDSRKTIYFDGRRPFAFFIIDSSLQKLIFCGKYIAEKN